MLTHAAFDSARTVARTDGRPRRDVETASLKRIVFDEGHHLFDAADSAFSACLSGQEAAELRRWVRGPEGRRRGRGLEQRLAELVAEHEPARLALIDAVRAAAALPGEGWSGRIAPPADPDGYRPAAQPIGPVEGFLAAMLEQLHARTAPNQAMSAPPGRRWSL